MNLLLALALGAPSCWPAGPTDVPAGVTHAPAGVTHAPAGVTHAPAGLTIIKLGGAGARLRSGTEVVMLAPGSRGFAIAPDAVTRVLSGEVWALAGGVIVKAREGDVFIFHARAGCARLFVAAGALEVLRPDGSSRALAAGAHEDFPVEAGQSCVE